MSNYGESVAKTWNSVLWIIILLLIGSNIRQTFVEFDQKQDIDCSSNNCIYQLELSVILSILLIVTRALNEWYKVWFLYESILINLWKNSILNTEALKTMTNLKYTYRHIKVINCFPIYSVRYYMKMRQTNKLVHKSYSLNAKLT